MFYHLLDDKITSIEKDINFISGKKHSLLQNKKRLNKKLVGINKELTDILMCTEILQILSELKK